MNVSSNRCPNLETKRLFTQVTHMLSGQSDKANKMFDWGKLVEVEGRILLQFAMQVHHSFIDGYHVGKFLEQLQERLDDF